jgi:polypyrimidine tract-binding protein 1
LDDIFVLFGVYGDVVRVKILFSKQETALVQLSTPQQTSTALENLNGVSLYGRSIHVSYSKHKDVVLPRVGDNV